jgi:hypothetical protein
VRELRAAFGTSSTELRNELIAYIPIGKRVMWLCGSTDASVASATCFAYPSIHIYTYIHAYIYTNAYTYTQNASLALTVLINYACACYNGTIHTSIFFHHIHTCIHREKFIEYQLEEA